MELFIVLVDHAGQTHVSGAFATFPEAKAYMRKCVYDVLDAQNMRKTDEAPDAWDFLFERETEVWVEHHGTVNSWAIQKTELQGVPSCEARYREQERNYLRSDAEAHLAEYFGIEPEYDAQQQPGEFQLFEDTMGFSFSEAINLGSDFYMLDELVDRYERKRDCTVPEYNTWQYLVASYVEENKMRKEERENEKL